MPNIIIYNFFIDVSIVWQILSRTGKNHKEYNTNENTILFNLDCLFGINMISIIYLQKFSGKATSPRTVSQDAPVTEGKLPGNPPRDKYAR